MTGKGRLEQKLMSPQGRRMNSGSLMETVFQGCFDLLPNPGLGTSKWGLQGKLDFTAVSNNCLPTRVCACNVGQPCRLAQIVPGNSALALRPQGVLPPLFLPIQNWAELASENDKLVPDNGR
ncbi:hypothetical protein MUG91_G6n517 [Manis pentadactyla]|nr:hypothetical protein MUG91_G6n517 [Manis pentadactyla]